MHVTFVSAISTAFWSARHFAVIGSHCPRCRTQHLTLYVHGASPAFSQRGDPVLPSFSGPWAVLAQGYSNGAMQGAAQLFGQLVATRQQWEEHSGKWEIVGQNSCAKCFALRWSGIAVLCLCTAKVMGGCL